MEDCLRKQAGSIIFLEFFKDCTAVSWRKKVSHKDLLYYCFDTEKTLFCPFAFKETEGVDKILQPAKVKPPVPNTGIRYFTTSETKHMSRRKSICRKIILKDMLT